jgi:hypothetical protein
LLENFVRNLFKDIYAAIQMAKSKVFRGGINRPAGDNSGGSVAERGIGVATDIRSVAPIF